MTQKQIFIVPELSFIFCIINKAYIFRLCGVSPFRGNSYHDVLRKNKEGTVIFYEKYWNAVSIEGRDLVMKMVAKNPQERISAKQALEHRWFYLSQTRVCMLSSALENMKKYQNQENRFDVSKIKPEFAMVTRTPLLLSRFSNQRSLLESPLVFSKNSGKLPSPAFLPTKIAPDGKRVS
jgi:serine/threonine protein kinase